MADEELVRITHHQAARVAQCSLRSAQRACRLLVDLGYFEREVEGRWGGRGRRGVSSDYALVQSLPLFSETRRPRRRTSEATRRGIDETRGRDEGVSLSPSFDLRSGEIPASPIPHPIAGSPAREADSAPAAAEVTPNQVTLTPELAVLTQLLENHGYGRPQTKALVREVALGLRTAQELRRVIEACGIRWRTRPPQDKGRYLHWAFHDPTAQRDLLRALPRPAATARPTRAEAQNLEAVPRSLRMRPGLDEDLLAWWRLEQAAELCPEDLDALTAAAQARSRVVEHGLQDLGAEGAQLAAEVRAELARADIAEDTPVWRRAMDYHLGTRVLARLRVEPAKKSPGLGQ